MPALHLLPTPPPTAPWYTQLSPTPAERRHGLEQQRLALLAHAVGDHLPSELALRVAQLDEQLALSA